MPTIAGPAVKQDSHQSPSELPLRETINGPGTDGRNAPHRRLRWKAGFVKQPHCRLPGPLREGPGLRHKGILARERQGSSLGLPFGSARGRPVRRCGSFRPLQGANAPDRTLGRLPLRDQWRI